MKKTCKLNLAVAAAGLLCLGLAGPALAFHSGGVAECAGCHSMHTAKAGGKFLLIGTDQSSTCLNCHENSADTGPNGYHISTADASLGAGLSPLQRTPGGDFAWLKKNYTWMGLATAPTNVESGDTHGHNIIAFDKRYVADATNATAPGGTFPAANLQCNSCHDPHGKYRRGPTGAVTSAGAPIIDSGSYDTSPVPIAGQAVGAYRLLAGLGYQSTAASGVSFPGVPLAVAPSTYNRTEAVTQTRVAYGTKSGSGQAPWGQWCSSCHGDMHTSSGKLVHPTDQNLGSSISGMYGRYVKSGNLNGTAATSYLSLVPFAQGAANSSFANLKANAKNDNSALGGPVSTDQVTCLSCHRAHASGFSSMLRWNNEYEFIVTDGAYLSTNNTMGRTENEWKAAYYDRPATNFATYQRGLCNKCHAKD